MGKKLAVSAVLLNIVDAGNPPPPPPAGNTWNSSDSNVVLQPAPDGNSCVANLSGSTETEIEVQNGGAVVAAGKISYDADTGILTFQPSVS